MQFMILTFEHRPTVLYAKINPPPHDNQFTVCLVDVPVVMKMLMTQDPNKPQQKSPENSG